ncbi:MAG: terminase small subunit [Dehalococcoidia bacterium]|nr:terminase small subunit [Dehalococcoidia bacterium]
MTSTSLTLRRQKFVSEYVETGNATQAATLAGYSRSGARVAGVLRTWQRFESIGPYVSVEVWRTVYGVSSGARWRRRGYRVLVAKLGRWKWRY